MTPNLNIQPLVLPTSYHRKRQAILHWFKLTDEKLCNFVRNGALDIIKAQTYFKLKVEGNPDISSEDKQRIANESKLWRMPV